jgi:alkylation response protein AidB-like acyl-CoA dehydrogenase
MNIEPTAEQYALVDAVAAFLGEQMPADRFLKQPTRTDAHWRALAELGLFGIAMPESAGGIGLGVAEEVLLYREAGRFLVSPCAIATTIAAKLALSAGDEILASELIAGDVRAAFAIPDGTDRLLLIDSEGSEQIVVAGRSSVLMARSALPEGTIVDALDATLSLIEVPLTQAQHQQIEAAAVDTIALEARLLSAAYLTGVAKAACDTAVAYANQREQFGRPIGSFQAIAHLCANMAVEADASAKQALFAALVLQEEADDPEFHVEAARLLAVRAAFQAARDTIQVHGGVGFTQEYTPHLYLKRTHLMQRVLAQCPPPSLLLEGGAFD